MKGEPTRERRILTMSSTTCRRRRGLSNCVPVRCASPSRTAPKRARPAGHLDRRRHAPRSLGKRQPFLTAKRLLTNQTFRDIYRTDTLDVDQRLKITSLTFLFTDLKGSTELYERVGDLVAFDLVRAALPCPERDRRGGGRRRREDHRRCGHGDVLHARPRAWRRRCACARRCAGSTENTDSEDLLLKIGIHEGPCLAVTLNDRQDYFGQTVNIASRVQGLAKSRAIFVTRSGQSDLV